LSEYRFKGALPGSSHAWAIGEARALPAGRLAFLDLGAWKGDVGLAIREARGEARLEGIEPDGPARAELGRRYDAVWPSLDARPADSPPADVGLALDVIEHVVDPVTLLRALARAVKPGCHLLVSVPNVAHWSARASLLLGRFEYADSGIFDRTHVRFFTPRSFRAALEEAGLEVERSDSSVAPAELVLPGPIVNNPLWSGLRTLRKAGARAWPGLLAYQLMARARVPARIPAR
jgi:SAM-dependent methyltransferase